MRNVNFHLLAIGLFLFSVGCAPVVSLIPGAESVKVAKSDPPDNYQEVGPISAYDGRGCGAFGYKGTYERTVISMKNLAYSMGGDYIQIFTITEPHLRGDCFDNVYKLSGTVYKKIREFPSPTPIRNSPAENEILLEKLRLLKQLRDEGLITEKQYEEKQQQLLK